MMRYLCALALSGLLAGAGLLYGGCGDDDAAPEPCGDGVVDPQEACDDGNTVDGDGCTSACEAEHGFVCWNEPSICRSSCGDGLVASVEGCDDGGFVLGDGCNADCVIEPGWECAGEPSVCTPVCGDGQLVADEACDDGNLVAGDGCGPDCTVEDGYVCTGTPSECLGVCGNGGMTPDEGCDDGNLSPGDGCAADCTVEAGWTCAGSPSVCTAVCGDGVTAGAETCDDAGESATCDDDCTAVSCGDGNANATAGEECDDGGETATCNADCTLAECGDGHVNSLAGESCDDGNTSPGDGCDGSCTPEPGYTCGGEPSVCSASCGDGVVAGAEQCDDAGESATCDADCTFALCGDGIVNELAQESCDDGNLDPADGCDASCVPEPGFDCVGEPSVCSTDCGDGVVVGNEECDDAGESATCDADCSWASCGDGTLNVTALEECDGADLGGEDCVSQGFDSGTLACTAGCALDDSGCGACPDGTCNGGESACSCPADCAEVCGDGCCTGAETPTSCPADCSACPGAIVNGTCVYLANPNALTLSAAQNECQVLGAGWGLCAPAILCDVQTLTYLGTTSCDCNLGGTNCACGSAANLYIHTGAPNPHYIRTALVANCDWAADACTVSGSETCGAALCCN